MSANLFSTDFFTSLISSDTNSRFSLSDYFTDAYSRDYDFCSYLPHELCHKSASVASHFSYEANNLNSLCLIHTTNGTGHLFCHAPNGISAEYELSKDTLALIDCRKIHKLSCQHNIWDFTICFVSTIVPEFYAGKIIESGNFIYSLKKYPDVLDAWQKVLKNSVDDEIHGIVRSKQLIELFEQMYLLRAVEQNVSYHVPSYIAEIRRRFNEEYYREYSLDDLAAEYDVNKYRLCREFAKYYNYTPIQYLSKVRVDKAKDFLLNTDEKIVDISQMVGIENVNHFIRLFKEKTGVTPLTYRKETPIL